MLHCSELKIEQAVLTGESEPITCDTNVYPADTGVTDAHNLAFNGTLPTQGVGLGLVIRTGDDTFIGNIARLTSQTESGETTMEREVRVFVTFIGYLAIAMATLFFIIGVARKMGEGKAYV